MLSLMKKKDFISATSTTNAASCACTLLQSSVKMFSLLVDYFFLSVAITTLCFQ